MKNRHCAGFSYAFLFISDNSSDYLKIFLGKFALAFTPIFHYSMECKLEVKE